MVCVECQTEHNSTQNICQCSCHTLERFSLTGCVSGEWYLIGDGKNLLSGPVDFSGDMNE